MKLLWFTFDWQPSWLHTAGLKLADSCYQSLGFFFFPRPLGRLSDLAWQQMCRHLSLLRALMLACSVAPHTHTHFRDDKDSWLCFSPLCESNVTIRTQHWQATWPRTYVALSALKKPAGSSTLFGRISVACLLPLLHLGSVKVAHPSDVYSECWR